MSQLEEQQHRPVAEDFDQLRHDLLNPLATTRGRAQLLTRAVERSTGIDQEERVRLLRGLAAIDLAVTDAVVVLERAMAQPNSDK